MILQNVTKNRLCNHFPWSNQLQCSLVKVLDSGILSKILVLSLNFISFTTITKQVIQLKLIMLVGTDVCFPVVFVWGETGVPRGNPPVWRGDHMIISHADVGYWTQVAAWEASALPLRQPDSTCITHLYYWTVIFLNNTVYII